MIARHPTHGPTSGIWISLATLLALVLSSGIVLADRVDRFVFNPSDVAYPLPRPGAMTISIGDVMMVAGGMGADGHAVDAVSILAPSEDPLPATLPGPLSYGTAVSDGRAAYLVGGFDGEHLSAEVWKLEWAEGGLKATALPDLPSPLCLAAVVKQDHLLFVIGGLSARAPATCVDTVFQLDLKGPAAGWTEGDAFPGTARIRAMAVARDGALYVMGGQQLRADADGALQAVTLSDGWEYRHVPLDGTTTRGWRKRSELPKGLAAAAVHPSGNAHAIVAGGFTGTTPFSLGQGTPPDMLSDEVYIYHGITDTWVDGGKLPHPVAEAAAVELDGAAYLFANLHVEGATETGGWSIEILRTVKKMRGLDYTVIVLYFLGMAAVGFYFSRKQDSSEEFALGSRKVKWWAAAVSMFATGASSFSFMAIPAMAFRTNLVWFAPVLMFLPFFFFNAYFVYPLLRRLKLTSTYAYLEARFGTSLRLIASVQWILATLATMSVIMLLPALAVSAVTGMNIFVCVLVLGLLTTIYTSIGGFEAVIWTDFAQGMLMLLGPVIMIVLAIGSLPGGFGEFVTSAGEAGKFDAAIWSWDVRLPVYWVLALGVIYQNMAFVSQQHVIQRVYATPLRDARRLAGLFAVIAVLISALVTASGIAIFAYFKAYPDMMDPAMQTDQIIPLFIIQRLPTGLAGLLIAAIFAASMSTLSSGMNSAATIFAEDYYRRFRKNAGDHEILNVMRTGSLVAGLFGTGMTLYMASMQVESMFKLLMIFIALIGGGFIGIYILGMFTRRANTPGVVVGAVLSIGCVLYVKDYTSIHWMAYTPVAVTTCVVLGYLASLVLPHTQKDLTGLTVFDQLKQEVGAPEASKGEK